jgi:hypothetical protein
MRVRLWTMLVALAALAGTAAAGAAVKGGEGAAGTLALKGTLQLVSTQGATCPPDVTSTTECFGRRSTGRVAGLGPVTVVYTYLADLGHPSCASGSVKILDYAATLAVPGKGDLRIGVAAHPDCLSPAAGLSPTQSLTILGGTGIYAGAAGSGTVSRSLFQTDRGAAGRETWSATLTVPELEFDVTRPTLSGPTSRVVRAPRGAKFARVTFAVAARDDRDGALPVVCSRTSGSRFKVGSTRVTCSATDGSGNTGTAVLRITVKPRR